MSRLTAKDIFVLSLAFLLVISGQVISEGGLYLTPLAIYSSIHKIVLLICMAAAATILILGVVHRKHINALFFEEKSISYVLIFSSLFFSFGLWHAYANKGWQGWMLYPPIGIFFSTLGIVTIAFIATQRSNLHSFLVKVPEKTLLKASVIVFIAMSCLIAGWAYEGIPHFGDATIYAAEANLILSGDIASNSAGGSLLVYPPPINEGPNGIFGKYPYGWPLLLATFVKLGIGWLANPSLIIFLAIMLRLVVIRLYQNKSLANASSIVLLLSGFAVLASTEWLSHLTVCSALMLFYYFFDKAVIGKNEGKLETVIHSTAAGASLFYAIHTRQLDAFVFTLPIIFYSLYIVSTQFFKVWLPLIIIGLWGLAAVALHISINKYLRGDALESPYGGNYAQQVAGQASTAKDSIFDYFFWAHQSIVDFGYFWFGGAAWAIGLIVVGLCFGKLLTKRAYLFFSCWSAILLSYAVISFYGLGWFGPRWYFPLLPVASLCIAGTILYFKERLISYPEKGNFAKFNINYVIIATVASITVSMPNWAARLKLDSPFSVNTVLFEAVEEQNINNAVVGVFDHSREIEGKLFRNVIFKMSFPLESNNIIYVIMKKDWINEACKTWPHREIYKPPETSSFVLQSVTCGE